MTLGSTGHTINDGGGTMTLSGTISDGLGRLQHKMGAGTLVISGANTNDYTGTTAVTAGQLTVSDANGLDATGATNDTTVAAAARCCSVA